MEKATMEKALNGTLMQDGSVYREPFDILNAYDADASLHERTETIERAVMSAFNVTEQQLSQDGKVVQLGGQQTASEDDTGASFIELAEKILITELVNALLTPKVLLLIQFNQRLTGENALDRNLVDRYDYSIEAVLRGMKGLLTSVIKEVIDTIQKELLRIIMARINEIINSYVKAMTLEYADKLVKLLKDILSCFKLNREAAANGYGYRSGDENSVVGQILDRVDSADIDELLDEIIPKTNPC
jgi:hypothetical protein